MKEGVAGCVWAGLEPLLQVKGSRADLHVPAGWSSLDLLRRGKLGRFDRNLRCALDLPQSFCLIMGEFL